MQFAARTALIAPLLTVLLLNSLQAQSEEALARRQPPPSTAPPTQNWAQEYVIEDPLVVKDTVSLDDIKLGLESVSRRGSVIDRHFKRVEGATEAEKREFLSTALQSEFLEVQRQAARALSSAGMLEAVVRDLLLEYLASEDAGLRQVAVIALEHFELKSINLPESYWKTLVEGLASEDEAIVEGMAACIEEHGVSAVPALLDALRYSNSRAQREAAQILSRLVGSRWSVDSTWAIEQPRSMSAPPPATAPELEPPPAPTRKPAPAPAPARKPAPAPAPTEAMPKGAQKEKATHSARALNIAKSNLVQVYFGTNRERLEVKQQPWGKVLLYPIVAACLLVAIFFGWRNEADWKKKHGCFSVVVGLIFLASAIWAIAVFRAELLDRWRVGTGPQFGSRRDSQEEIHYGTCTVSIPPNHQVGQIESPKFGLEDEDLHVVLQASEEMEEKVFFEEVRKKVAVLPEDDRSCFVFIHGFNVTFENAAKRTAQIHYDLQFSGVPIFFSWPSRASVRHYFSDRNEIEFSRYVIKQFLLDVSQRVNANRIHVIAHSMGADATCRAIAELGERGKIFDQIILAAPDIDRDVFRLQVAPKLMKTANRTTLYSSKNDWALVASETFNDSLRAGDSRQGVLVMKGLDSIDASGIDTDLLGHSYYGDCLPILQDVRQLVGLNLPPSQRKLLAWPVENELTYWTLANEDSAANDEADSNSTSPDAPR